MRFGRVFRIAPANLFDDFRRLVVLFLEVGKLMQHLIGGHATKADGRVDIVNAADV
ncbi:hypothetical protein SDC9_120393 [bioreactor metagenome]|uniref:Uncharacterized protein n=1 Tax=bioreactor metagenome TaxID=1076179 RepID=A0A645C994_9ZZZZ